ncbi:MAG TPA: thiamine phosphate synthase [Acidobacteriaceae bacterium]|jgi:thiamine-phosphate pyrophosphorylase
MRLYAITDRRLLPGTHENGYLSDPEREGLVRLAGEWAALGVEYVQLREKDLGVRELTELAAAMMAAMRHSASGGAPRLLVNAGAAGAAEAARAAGAAGIHLPGRWHAEQVGTARILGTVSVGCHSVGEVAVARTAGADLALLSPIFRTESHPKARPLGVEALTAAAQTAGKMPVYALGGVNAENAALCIAAGAAGVAGIRTFLSGDWAAAAQKEPGHGRVAFPA